jgi:predicted ArsR family transcriptional regulator
MESQEEQISAIAALDEPTRRRLYDYVVARPEPVSREDAAAALDLPRATAAFHLDRLVDQQLLDATFRRRTGRTGPGAGRPTKLYQRSTRPVAVSLPPRRYDLAGRLLAGALDHAERSGDTPGATLHRHAYQLGRDVGDTARGGSDDDGDGSDGGDHDTGTSRATALRVLQAHGFEPRSDDGTVTLANCPFHALAQDYTDIVCGMNLHLVTGILDGLAPTGLTAHLDPMPHRCCVQLRATSGDGTDAPDH